MLFYLILFSMIWFMIFTAGRFLRYYNIVREHKNQTTAVVTSVTPHKARNREEKREKSIDVTLEYTIDEQVGSTEIIVPAATAEKYKLGASVPISYKVAPNGTVHIASQISGIKKICIAHLIAFVLEVVAFVAIWIMLL